MPPNSQLALSRLVLTPASTTDKYKWCWAGGTLTLKGRKSALMKERSRTKPGREINLRDTKMQKRHIKGLSEEEVMGRENTKTLNQNDWIANALHRLSPLVHDIIIFSMHHLPACPGAGWCCSLSHSLSLYFEDTQRPVPRPAKGLRRGNALRRHSSLPDTWHAHCRAHKCPMAQTGRSTLPKTCSHLLRLRAVLQIFHPLLLFPWLYIQNIIC